MKKGIRRHHGTIRMRKINLTEHPRLTGQSDFGQLLSGQ